MFKLIGTLSNCISSTVTDLTECIKPLTNSAKLGAKALELNAQNLHDDVEFECMKRNDERSVALAAYREQLDALLED